MSEVNVSSHFSCIGLTVDSKEAFQALLNEIMQRSVGVPFKTKYNHTKWADSSGAAVFFHGSKNGPECITPFFFAGDGASRWHVKTSAPCDDSGCLHCGGVDCDVLDNRQSQWVTRSSVQLVLYQPYKEWLKELRQYDLEVVAFGHQAAFFQAKEQFDEAMKSFFSKPNQPQSAENSINGFAENFFLPTGMFSQGKPNLGERAMILCAGKVEHVETLKNSMTDVKFLHIRIEALPGPLNVVLDEATCQGNPDIGNIALLEAWLVGCPTVDPP